MTSMSSRRRVKNGVEGNELAVQCPSIDGFVDWLTGPLDMFDIWLISIRVEQPNIPNISDGDQLVCVLNHVEDTFTFYGSNNRLYDEVL